ncbi:MULTISPECIES: VanZ family protein [unclassified Agrococcus]|uniref:VanZ family protein n=1 Tax=unclassified Agrococcus TaxID=2615065 RepID=UPI00361A6DFE
MRRREAGVLSTILATYPWIAPSLLAVVVVLGPLVAWALAPVRRAAMVLAVAAFVAVGALTLWPTRAAVGAGCSLRWDVDLLAPEPLANVVLLVPPVLLLAVATRQPSLAALVGAIAAAAIEIVQAVLPMLGRACDVGDWAANATGSVLGAVLAAIGIAIARSRRRRARADRVRR